MTGWFGEAVIIFFVLSGYLVGGIASARASIGKFSLMDYAVDRVARLYVALLPALLLTALLDAVATNWFADIGFFTHTHPMIQQKVNSAPYLNNMSLSSFISNALMLQTIVTPSFGSNDPLWTISLEFWFYAVFGIGLASLLAARWCASLALSQSPSFFCFWGRNSPFIWASGFVASWPPSFHGGASSDH